MDTSRLFLIIVTLTILSSGCMQDESSSGLEIGKNGKAVTVTAFDVQPREILSGSRTQVKMGIANTGYLNSEINVGENGKKLLKNYCSDIFNIQSFDAYSSSRRNAPSDGSFELKPGEKLKATWSLENSNPEAVPLQGFRCPMRVEVPFNYSVEAYQQIQIKENTEIQGTPNLRSRTSLGPMNMRVETIGSTSEKGAPTFVNGDNIELLIQMRNKQPEKSSYQGLVDVGAPVITTSENLEIDVSSCNLRAEGGNSITGNAIIAPPGGGDDSNQNNEEDNGGDSEEDSGGDGNVFEILSPPGEESTNEERLVNRVRITQDMRLYQGQSRIVRCGVELKEDLSSPSIQGEITAKANYTYVKDLGQTQLKVEYRGR